MAANIQNLSDEELLGLQPQQTNGIQALSNEQLMALGGLQPVESQRFRTALQGVTYNFADEIEAAVRSVLPESMGGGEYQQIRNELSQKLRAYKEANPGEAITYELMGALVPAIGTMMIPGMQAMSVPRLASVAGIEGLASYVGGMERPPTMEDIPQAAIATGVSAVGGPAIQKTFSGAGQLGKWFVNKTRSALGNRPADAVQAELLRLAEGTGKTVDEIVQDVIDGKIMAENRTLQAAVRSLRSGGGEAGALITEQIPARRAATRASAMGQMQAELADSQGNVLKAMKASDKELGKLESDAYSRVFGDKAEVTPEIANQMEDILKRFPDVRDSLSKIYGERNLVPLFAFDDAGALTLKRIPTVEDGEILRRAIDEQASGLYRAGAGTRGETAALAGKELRSSLDEAYPDLSAVRQQAAQRRTIRDYFDEGRKALGAKSADEVEILFEQAQAKGDHAVRAFRAGVMDSIRNRAKRSPSLMGRMADPDRQEGAVLRIVYPESSVDDIQRKLDIAGGSEELYQRVLFNSMTAPEQAAAAQMGLANTVQDVARVASGDTSAIISMVARNLAKAAPKLSDADRLSLAQVLFSQDPDAVRRALTNNAAMDELINRATSLLNYAGATGRTITAQQTGGLLSEGNQ